MSSSRLKGPGEGTVSPAKEGVCGCVCKEGGEHLVLSLLLPCYLL